MVFSMPFRDLELKTGLNPNLVQSQIPLTPFAAYYITFQVDRLVTLAVGFRQDNQGVDTVTRKFPIYDFDLVAPTCPSHSFAHSKVQQLQKVFKPMFPNILQLKVHGIEQLGSATAHRRCQLCLFLARRLANSFGFIRWNGSNLGCSNR